MMSYTIEDVKRLVPEARKTIDLGGSAIPDIVFYLSSRPFHASYGSGKLILDTRRQLEIAREFIRRVTADSNVSDHLSRETIDRMEDL